MPAIKRTKGIDLTEIISDLFMWMTFKNWITRGYECYNFKKYKGHFNVIIKKKEGTDQTVEESY